MVNVIHWFNPLIWIIQKKVAVDIELPVIRELYRNIVIYRYLVLLTLKLLSR